MNKNEFSILHGLLIDQGKKIDNVVADINEIKITNTNQNNKLAGHNKRISELEQGFFEKYRLHMLFCLSVVGTAISILKYKGV